MPEEIFIIIVVSILAGTFSRVVKLVLDYKRDQHGTTAGRQQTSETLTASELQRMIEESVHKATDHLSDRIETLEASLNGPLTTEGRIDVPGDAEEADPVAVPRRRTRA